MKAKRLIKPFLLLTLGISAVTNLVPIFNRVETPIETSAAESVASYYSTISDSLTGDSLKSALRELNKTKLTKQVTYAGFRQGAAYFDLDPDGSGKIIGFYNNAKVGPAWDGGSTWNREHVWPNSRNGDVVEDDAHMVRPTASSINSSRGNNVYGESGSATYDPGEFYPSYRGIAARIVFYCAMKEGSLVLNDSTSNEGNNMGKLTDLLKWNLQYKPGTSTLELRTEQSRNNAIHAGNTYSQGNRNPFIDHPEYACKIWGDTNATTRQICAGSYEDDFDPDQVLLTHISVSNPQTTFTVGDTFVFGGTATAHYSDSTTVDITDEVTFSGYNMNSTGNQTVTVDYQGVQTTYSIRVNSDGSSAATASYVKVTTTLADYSGTYLIVNETNNVAFNGSLTTLDATNNNVKVDIENNAIEATDDLKDKTFTIAKSGSNYTIKSKSGYYIGNTGNSNALKSSTSTTYTNTITISSGNANIVSSSSYLRFNAANDQMRFRYYKSSSYTNQKAVALYKLEEAAAPTPLQEAQTWSKAFVQNVTCDGGNTKPSTSKWSSQATAFNGLSTDAKALLKSASYTLVGSIVTATNGTDTDVAKAAARYDYIVGKYSSTSYSAFITGRTVQPLGGQHLVLFSQQNNITLLFVIASATALFTTLLIMKKKKKSN